MVYTGVTVATVTDDAVRKSNMADFSVATAPNSATDGATITNTEVAEQLQHTVTVDLQLLNEREVMLT